MPDQGLPCSRGKLYLSPWIGPFPGVEAVFFFLTGEAVCLLLPALCGLELIQDCYPVFSWSLCLPGLDASIPNIYPLL